jgi:septin family protein
MVAGAHGTGKTSLIKLFIDTSVISPTATPEQKQSVDSFLSTSRKSTKALRTACVEIAENRFDRVLLTLIDTPGLDFTDGKELRCERDVTSLVRYLDSQYDETMGEESKVVRQSKGDQHVHLYVLTLASRGSLELTSRLTFQVHLPNRPQFHYHRHGTTQQITHSRPFSHSFLGRQ